MCLRPSPYQGFVIAGNQQLEEIVRLKATVTSLDREKDGLQGAVDDKTERLVHTEDGVRDRVSTACFGHFKCITVT